MASYKDIYGSRFANADDLPDKPVMGKILEVGIEPFPDAVGRPKNKIVVKIDGIEKELILNLTNAESIANKYGDDFEQWPGNDVVVRRGKTRFQGRQVDCVVVVPPGVAFEGGAA